MAGRYLLGLATGILLFPLAVSVEGNDRNKENQATRVIENEWGSVYFGINPDGRIDVSVNYLKQKGSGVVHTMLFDEGGDGVYEWGQETRFWCEGRSMYSTLPKDRSDQLGEEYLDKIAPEANEARRKILEEAVVEDLLKQK